MSTHTTVVDFRNSFHIQYTIIIITNYAMLLQVTLLVYHFHSHTNNFRKILTDSPFILAECLLIQTICDNNCRPWWKISGLVFVIIYAL